MASVEYYSGPLIGPLPAVEGSGAQTFKKGDLVKFSSGTLVVATDGAIDGVAAINAVGTTSSAISYYPVGTDTLWVAKNGSTTAQTDVGLAFQFTTFSAGAQTGVAGTNWSQCDAICVALDPRDAVGTSGGRNVVRFLPVAVKAT